jgi:acyl-CoA synthetase (AMP-forming)/AMP-acid ligase II
MRGYWNAPEESAQAFFAGAWLRTGDLGRMDARGYVEFVERRKDVIVVSGFKAYPSEIEQVALAHPGVKDAGAVGMPHPKSGEAVALFVVKRDPALTAEALAEHCAQRPTSGPRASSSAMRFPSRPSARCCTASFRRGFDADQGTASTSVFSGSRPSAMTPPRDRGR